MRLILYDGVCDFAWSRDVCLLYVSTVARRFALEELKKMLSVSRCKNTEADIRGLLFYLDDNFMQVFVGAPADVEALYLKIQCDPRHHSSKVLLRSNAEERLFPGGQWALRTSIPIIQSTPMPSR